MQTLSPNYKSRITKQYPGDAMRWVNTLFNIPEKHNMYIMHFLRTCLLYLYRVRLIVLTGSYVFDVFYNLGVADR